MVLAVLMIICTVFGVDMDASAAEISLKYSVTGQTKSLSSSETPVGMHGKLHITGQYMYDESNNKVQLRGASLHGIQWDVGYNYITKTGFQNLRDEWGVNLIRVPVYVTQSGYTEGSAAAMDTRIQTAVQYATELGMYVLIDWHLHDANASYANPNDYKSQAAAFFEKYAKMYKSYNNVLFEIANEPIQTPWYSNGSNDLYSYSSYITGIIRKYTDAIVICGTNTWSQEPDEVVGHTLSYKNVAYTIHFYAATHIGGTGNWVYDNTVAAINAGIPVFCTEFGICDASGNGSYNISSANTWISLFDKYSISYCCWHLSNKAESSAYLNSSCSKTSGWTGSDLSTTGVWVVNTYRPKADAELSQAIQQTVNVESAVDITYRTHVQDIGWMDWVKNGVYSGTTGLAKRMEAINIKLPNMSAAKLSVQYTTHCQDYGWLAWSRNGEINGTEGESKRLEAIKIQLTGTDKDKYDIYYRVHAQDYGWLGWAKNGECAGTAGQAKRLEGLQIVIVKKGDVPSSSYLGVTSKQTSAYKHTGGTDNPTISGSDTTHIAYRTHVQDYGWQAWKYDGNTAGTTGQSKRLEGIYIRLQNQLYTGKLQYRTHVQDYGWMNWVDTNQMSGTSGQSKRLEAIQIRLTDELSTRYDVYYRVHAQDYGWLGWAKNGEMSGTSGGSKCLEGIQIVLVSKGGSKPSNTYKGITSNNASAFIKVN